jgi:hypothetical protein
LFKSDMDTVCEGPELLEQPAATRNKIAIDARLNTVSLSRARILLHSASQAPCSAAPFAGSSCPRQAFDVGPPMKQRKLSSGVQTIGSPRTLKLVFTTTDRQINPGHSSCSAGCGCAARFGEEPWAMQKAIVRAGSPNSQCPLPQAAGFRPSATTPAGRKACGARAAGLARR